MEAAALGFRALAVSLETAQEHHLTYSREVDFSGAAHFTFQFARLLLEKHPFPDIDLLKVDVPSDANSETSWVLTRLARQRYYAPVAPERESWSVPGTVGYKEAQPVKEEPSDSDVFVVRNKRLVSVTPISLDMTSRADFHELEEHYQS
jgi:5'-nucleotidase